MTLDSQEPPSTVSASTRRAIVLVGVAPVGAGCAKRFKFQNIPYITRKGFQPWPSTVAAITKIDRPQCSRGNTKTGKFTQLVDINYQLA